MGQRYRPEVLEALGRHGIVPRDDTPPALVREYLNDLYRYEIRRLRARLLRGEFPKATYSGRVAQLRDRYLLLAIRTDDWTI